MATLAPGQSARALFDYAARAPDELNFKKNDVILILGKDKEDDGWYIGELAGQKGLFPNNYVQLVTPAAGAASSSGSIPTPPTASHVRVESFETLYVMADVLGRGRFSQVRRCVQKSSKRSCAVKLMDLADPELGTNKAQAETEVLAEVGVLRQLRHPGVVQVWLRQAAGVATPLRYTALPPARLLPSAPLPTGARPSPPCALSVPARRRPGLPHGPHPRAPRVSRAAPRDDQVAGPLLLGDGGSRGRRPLRPHRRARAVSRGRGRSPPAAGP